jgi:hypothetical protein
MADIVTNSVRHIGRGRENSLSLYRPNLDMAPLFFRFVKLCRISWQKGDVWPGPSQINGLREIIRNCEAWRGYVERNFSDYSVVLTTGSTSGSLPGFRKIGGLLPAGELLKREEVALYSGELLNGAMEDGVNNRSISFSLNLEDALRYAERVEGWFPANHLSEMAELTSDLERRSKKPDNEFFIALTKMQIRIEEQRAKIWPSLTQMEQGFVSQPFSLVYGINGSLKSMDVSRFMPVWSHYKGERAYEGFIPAVQSDQLKNGKMVIYVPKAQVRIVGNYLMEGGQDVPVRPIEGLNFLKVRKALENDIKRMKINLHVHFHNLRIEQKNRKDMENKKK